MLPLRLRESLIGGMLLSGTHLYSCLTHTTTQYTRQLDTQLAMETETQLQASLPWQEVSKRERESAALQLFVAATNQVGGGVAVSSINRFLQLSASTKAANVRHYVACCTRAYTHGRGRG